MAAAEPAPRAQKTAPEVPGSWRYRCDRPSRLAIALAVGLSAGLHAGIFFGFGHAGKAPAPAKAEPLLAVALVIPELKDLEEPEPEAIDDSAAPQDTSVPVPMQQDLPQIPRPTDFVQPINFASLLEPPDFSQVTLTVIPENIRRSSGKLAEGIGAIFNLADLDREPALVFQPAPIYPHHLRREDLSGTVKIEFIVDTQGRVLNAVVIDTTDRRFDEAALAGVAKWKFKPGMKGGRKVNTRMAVPIVFTLVDGAD